MARLDIRCIMGLLPVLLALVGATGTAQSRPADRLAARIGVAATPANFPKHIDADIQNMFKLSKDVGSTAVFIYQWNEPHLVDVARKVIETSRQLGITPIIGISPTTLGGGRSALDLPDEVRRAAGRKPSFADKAVHEAYMRDVVELAKLKPPYLCLATEINMLALADLKEYLSLAHVLKQVYPLIKKASPDTKVFVSFQWDVLRMMDVKEPKKVKEWSKQIDVFRPQLDVVAFTSYPAEQFDGKPEKIPADYYDQILEHVQSKDEVIFMEIGWPSAGKGSEEGQVEFIKRLPTLMAKVKPNIIDWSLLHDVPTSVLPVNLATTGLIATSGKQKPAYQAFKEMAR